MQRDFMIALIAALLILSPQAALATTEPGHPVAQAAEQFGGLERTHGLVIAIEGETVFEHAFAGPAVDEPVNVKSLAKTFLAALVGAAIERGVVAGADQPVVELLGELVPAEAPAGIERVTVGHLLSMQAGLEPTSGPNYGTWVASEDWIADALGRPFIDEPGGRMLYSTGNSHLLSGALTETTETSTLALARAWLGNPLNIRIPDWPTDPQGIHFGGNNMRLSPHALIRLGELYHNDGVVDGRRVLPEGWVETSWTPRGQSQYHDDYYGYGWFVGELADERVYYGWGFGGQVLYVVPSLALTVALTSDPTPPSPRGAYLARIHEVMAEHLIPAVREAAP